MREGVAALTEKEKQTLRLVVRGHDAKSIARSLNLSVHTVNERLRGARRKMAVSSSREAARLLLTAEGDDAAAPTPDCSADKKIGDDTGHGEADQRTAPDPGVGRTPRPPRILFGVVIMTLALGLLALIGLPHVLSTPPQTPAVSRQAPDTAVVESARQWLALVDAGRWEDSYRATGAAFRALNTPQVWATTSERVRVPLGAVLSRTFLTHENLPAPPHGYEVVKFRTRFANRVDAVETVTLDRDDGAWRVVGIMID